MTLDLLIRGGRLIDPDAGIDAVLDLAVRNGVVVGVETQITADAGQVIDADGLIVSPGLIDLHTHVFHGSSFWGVDPAALAAGAGVTTWVDAGSAGAYTIAGLRQQVIDTAAVHVVAFLNISSIGLVAHDFELRTPEFTDAGVTIAAIDRHRDILVGIKVRMGTPTAGDRGLEPLRLARTVAEATGLPIMVHISDAPPLIGDVLALLRPGDIVTHCCTGASMSLVDRSGQPVAGVREAVAAGILLDVGHGAGGFSFRSAEALLAAGIALNTISSDLHQMSIWGPGAIDDGNGATIRIRPDAQPEFGLVTCLNKLLALGVDLPTALAGATARPAAVIGETGRRGTLQTGAVADISLLRLREQERTFVDPSGDRRVGRVFLEPEASFVAGRRLEGGEHEPAPWVIRNRAS